MSTHDSNETASDVPEAPAPQSAEHLELQKLIGGAPGIEALIGLHTCELQQGGLLVGAKIAFPPGSSVEHIGRTLTALERDICNAVPAAKAIYLQPDLYVDSPTYAPSTDHIVIQSGN